MKHIKNHFEKIFLIIILPAAASFAQQKIFSLEESLITGLKNSNQLKLADSRLASADAKITEAGSMMLPRINFSAGYTRLSEVPPFTISTPFLPVPIKAYDIIPESYNLKLSLQQPLFTGFRLSSVKDAADLNYTAAEADYYQEVNEAAYRIHNAFWNFYKAQQISDLLEENLRQTALHLEDTKKFLENGLVTRNDLLKLEVQYSNTELVKIEAENNVEMARIGFNKAIGIDLDSFSGIEAKEIVPDSGQFNIEQSIEEAVHNRTELKALEFRIRAADENITAEASGWFPTVYLFGNYYYSKPNQRILPPENKFNDTWDIGVSLNWELWNWGYTSSKKTQAEEAKFQAETSLSNLEDAVEIEVYQSYLNWSKSIQKVEVINKSIKQAEENYRITREKYNSQLATSSDLIDAEISLLQAKTNLTNALVDYELARITLEKSIGRRVY